MKKLIPILLAVAFSGSFAILFAVRFGSHTPSEAEDFAHLPKSDSPSALFNSPDFAFTDQHGQPATKISLTGEPYIANFIFTTCRTVCPLLTSKMVRLQRDLPGLPMHFVSFSVDPEHDTVEALSKYADQWNPDEKRWLLLETTLTGLAAAAEGFHVTAQKTDGGIDAVMHSAVFMLVDKNGVVRGVYNSEETGEFKSLVRDARTLLGPEGAEPVQVAKARSGVVLFHELSCANCHEHPELAPPLGGLIGKQRELETRALITADDAYLKESIVAPVAKRVVGYPLMMPSFSGHLSAQELDSLVEYIKALPPPISDPNIKVEIDPVCHMKVRVTDNVFTAPTDAGTPAYFCSEWCKARFVENPDAYRR